MLTKEGPSQAFMLKQRNYAYEEADDTFIRFQNRLIEQDREMVKNQKPELHLNTVWLSIAYSKLFRELGVSVGMEICTIEYKTTP